MDKKQFALFADALRTYYPKEKIMPNEQAMALWFDLLRDIPYELACQSLKKWVSENPWSPAISDIRQQAAKITDKKTVREIEIRLIRGRMIEGET